MEGCYQYWRNKAAGHNIDDYIADGVKYKEYQEGNHITLEFENYGEVTYNYSSPGDMQNPYAITTPDEFIDEFINSSETSNSRAYNLVKDLNFNNSVNYRFGVTSLTTNVTSVQGKGTLINGLNYKIQNLIINSNGYLFTCLEVSNIIFENLILMKPSDRGFLTSIFAYPGTSNLNITVEIKNVRIGMYLFGYEGSNFIYDSAYSNSIATGYFSDCTFNIKGSSNSATVVSIGSNSDGARASYTRCHFNFDITCSYYSTYYTITILRIRSTILESSYCTGRVTFLYQDPTYYFSTIYTYLTNSYFCFDIIRPEPNTSALSLTAMNKSTSYGNSYLYIYGYNFITLTDYMADQDITITDNSDSNNFGVLTETESKNPDYLLNVKGFPVGEIAD